MDECTPLPHLSPSLEVQILVRVRIIVHGGDLRIRGSLVVPPPQPPPQPFIIHLLLGFPPQPPLSLVFQLLGLHDERLDERCEVRHALGPGRNRAERREGGI